MSSSKRALLIASPFDNLRGPHRDVETMTGVLRKNSFNDITTCVGAEATRESILTRWKELVCRTTPNDAIVFYYSGHGALVKPDHDDVEKGTQSRSLQFIVPMDYDKSDTKDFKGILDVEISHFLWQITKKTENVTVILDCCHSGRMARNPKLGSRSSPRFLPGIQYHDIDSLVRNFQQETPRDDKGYPEGNPFTVRIVAATQNETAWEHEDQEEKWQGALTRALGIALEEAAGRAVSWHATMIRVRDILTTSNCPQHPSSEGRSKRIHFKLDEIDPGVFGFHSKGNIATIEGGRVAGFYVGDVLALLPHGSESQTHRLAEVRLSSIDAFESRGEISATRDDRVPEHGIAVQIERALRPSPVGIPPDIEELQKAVEASRFLRARTPGDMERAPHMQREGDSIVLYDEGGIEVSRSPSERSRQISSAAERLVRAKLFRSLKPEASEKLAHDLDVRFEVVEAGKSRPIIPSGETHVTQQERACIWLENKGRNIVYVNIFDVNIAGEIFLVNTDRPGGIEIESQTSYVYGKNRDGQAEGEAFSWPEDVPVCESIGESLVFIVTDHIIDLRHIESPGVTGRGDIPKSTLEDLTSQIASGGARNWARDPKRHVAIHFDTLEIPFVMHPTAIPAQAIPDPQGCEEWTRAIRTWPELGNTVAKGLLGAALRAGQGIPPCIWVVNEYTEPITVVVSKLRPSRLWTGSELNASTSGGGITLSTETFALPATRKTLQPFAKGPAFATGTFPLWNRRQRYGVITIYVGSEERLSIAHDSVPMGATAIFKGLPDLEIVEHGASGVRK